MPPITTITAILAAILVASDAAAVPAAEPPKCCVDRQFTGQMSEISGTHFPITGDSVFEDSYTFFAYDYYRKKAGVEHHLRLANGTEKVTKSLMDYNQGMLFVDTGNNTCYAEKILIPMEQPCIPADAVFLGESTLGYASESIKTLSWEYRPANSDIVYKRMFTKDGCVPIASAYYGTVNGVPKNSIQIFSNYSPGIPDPKILDTSVDPAYCYMKDSAPAAAPVGR